MISLYYIRYRYIVELLDKYIQLYLLLYLYQTVFILSLSLSYHIQLYHIYRDSMQIIVIAYSHIVTHWLVYHFITLRRSTCTTHALRT